MFDSFALSVRGSSHIRENIARQDNTGTDTDPAGWAIAARDSLSSPTRVLSGPN